MTWFQDPGPQDPGSPHPAALAKQQRGRRTARHWRRWGRWLALSLAIALLLGPWGTLGPWGAQRAAALPPSDAVNHWSRGCLTALRDRRLLPVDAAGRFRPDDPAPRPEFRQLVTRTLATVRPGAAPSTPLPSPDPNLPLTRGEAIATIAQAMGWATEDVAAAGLLLQQALADGDRVALAQRPAIAAALRSRAIVNYPHRDRLDPQRPVLRGEAAALLCQALENDLETPATDAFGPFVPPVPETRGVWLTNIDSDVLFDRDRLRDALTQLADLNFNTVYLTVLNGGYTLYPSEVARAATGIAIDPHPGLRGRDIVAEAIAIGQPLGLKIVPWLEFGLMAPANSALAQRHPDWLAQRQDGSTTFTYGSDVRVWLNPGHPRVQDFLVGLVNELVTRYPVDGIQFDDHFAAPVDLGYEPSTVAAYQLGHNGLLPPTDTTEPTWMRWRADRLSTLMDRIQATIRQQRPTAIRSLSPNPQHFAYPTSLQDWSGWVQRGWLDEVVIQVYRADLAGFEAELGDRDLQAARRRIPVSIGVLAGIKPRQIPIATVANQTLAVRRAQLTGVSYFFYETLWNLAPDPAPTRQQAFRRLFFHPAPRPRLLRPAAPPPITPSNPS